MSFESIQSGMAGVLASWAGDPEVRARIVTRAWASVVGVQVARRTEARGFEDGVLEVVVLDRSWEATLRQMSGELLRRMNRTLGQKMLERIRWVTDPATSNDADPTGRGGDRERPR